MGASGAVGGGVAELPGSWGVVGKLRLVEGSGGATMLVGSGVSTVGSGGGGSGGGIDGGLASGAGGGGGGGTPGLA
jgi:hypothetical protein